MTRQLSTAGDSDDSATSLLGGYHNNKKQFFKPTESDTFKLVKLGNVNVTFLDKTNLLGYDGQDYAKVSSLLPPALLHTHPEHNHRTELILQLVHPCSWESTVWRHAWV